MADAAAGRWAQLRHRVIDTDEKRAQYERKRDALIRVRELLIQLDAERERAGLSKAELARRMGVNPSVVRRLFTSDAGNPTLLTLMDVLLQLNIAIQLKRIRRTRPRPSASTRTRSRQRAAVA